MTETKQPSHEERIWSLYQEKCRKEGKQPSVQDFKSWTTALLKSL